MIPHLHSFLSQVFLGHLEDFHHLHQIVINFGSPEVFYFSKTPMSGMFLWLIPKNLDKQVADQMSGNVYMHASVVEDECSKVRNSSWNRRKTNQVLIDFSASVWLNKLASFP